MNELIQQARELCEKATPGPWEDNITDVWIGDRHIADVYNPIDSAFIAASRTLVPQLCDALEEEISRRYQAECNYDHWKAQAEKAEAEREKAAEFIRWVDDNFSHYMPQEYTDRLMALECGHFKPPKGE